MLEELEIPDPKDQALEQSRTRQSSLREAINRKLAAADMALELDMLAGKNSTQQRQKEALEDQVQRDEKAAEELGTRVQAETSESAAGDELPKVSRRIEQLRETEAILRSRDLTNLSAEQANLLDLTIQALDQPDTKVKLETATEVGHTEHSLKTLAPLAAELGRPFYRDGKLDLPALSRPETKLFLATLAAMTEAFRSGQAMPVSGLEDLPVEDKIGLYDLVKASLARHYPHIKAEGTYKYADLATATKTILQAANSIRQEAGTDLFSRIMPAARHQILGSDGRRVLANFL